MYHFFSGRNFEPSALSSHSRNQLRLSSTSTPGNGIVEENGAITITCEFHHSSSPFQSISRQNVYTVNWYWSPVEASSWNSKIGIYRYRQVEPEGSRKMVWNRRVAERFTVKVTFIYHSLKTETGCFHFDFTLISMIDCILYDET